MKRIVSIAPLLCCATAGRAQSVPFNGYMLVADPAAHAVHIYNTTTETYVGDMAAPDPGFTPVNVAVGPLGQVYVADLRGSSGRILEYGGPFYGYSTVLATVTAYWSLLLAHGPDTLQNQLFAVTQASPNSDTAIQIYSIDETSGLVTVVTPSPNNFQLGTLNSGSAFFGPPGSSPADALYVTLSDRVQAFNALNGMTPEGSVIYTIPIFPFFSDGATFDANGHLFLSVTALTGSAIFEDQNPFVSQPAWRTVVTTKAANLVSLAFDSSGSLYAGLANGEFCSGGCPLQKINPATGVAANIGPFGVLLNPISMAFWQSSIARRFPIYGGGWGFVQLPPGGELHLGVTPLPWSGFGTSASACSFSLQFIDMNGNVLASNAASVTAGQSAELDYTNTSATLQPARPVLQTSPGAMLEACGTALPTLALTNSNGSIVTFPVTSVGIPKFGPVGLPPGSTAQVSLTNDAVPNAFTPPDPCILTVWFLDPEGNVLQETSESISPGQTVSAIYTGTPGTLPTIARMTALPAASAMTQVQPMLQLTGNALACSALVPSLTVTDSSGNPEAAYAGVSAPVTASAATSAK